MRGVLALLLVGATVSGQSTHPLRCRRCIGAGSLDDCTFSVPCPAGEVCYMDEVYTEQLTIQYHGGCRPRDMCGSSPIVGKRDGSAAICSLCCDTKTSPECNTKLCGIKGSTSNQCYHCTDDGNGGAGVANPANCTNLVSCQSDEICGAETYRLSSQNTFEFKCLPKQICTLLTRMNLEEMDACRRPDADPERCSSLGGKRETSGKKVCTVCCGDSKCNNESCETLIDRLYKLWKAGVLDINTMTQKAPLPATTQAPLPATTPASG